MRKPQIGSSGMCLYFTEAPLSWNCIREGLSCRTTVCAYLCFSLCKPWDGTLYIDLRSLRARHEDWIFIKQFSNYKSFLCLLVKNFRNYFNWTKFLKKNFVIRGKSLRVEGVEESGPQNTSLPLSLGGSSRPLMRHIDLHIGEKIQRFDLYIKPADTDRVLRCVALFPYGALQNKEVLQWAASWDLQGHSLSVTSVLVANKICVQGNLPVDFFSFFLFFWSSIFVFL